MADPTHVDITIKNDGVTPKETIEKSVRETLQRQASPFDSLFNQHFFGGGVVFPRKDASRRWNPVLSDISDFTFPVESVRIYPMGSKLNLNPTMASTFVEPERPAEPQPEPDSPAVAMLRPLVADRKRVAEEYEQTIENTEEEIRDLEQELIETKARLEHERNCLTKAQTELKDAEEAIVKLGGTV